MLYSSGMSENSKEMTMQTPEYLTSPCAATMTCRDVDCPNSTKVDPTTGRAYITMGHAGFNDLRNNGAGFKSQAAARRAMDARLWGVR